jgi:hypothetical protein
MKRIKTKLILATMTVSLLSLSGCNGASASSSPAASIDSISEASSADSSSSALLSEADETLYLNEMKRSFNFFYNCISSDVSSPAYGLVADRARVSYASIASTGFALAALPIGVENGFVSSADAEARALVTLTNIANIENIHGFYWHFINMADATRNESSEVSIIDTAIMVFGGLIAGEYFGGDVETKANEIYEAVDWKWFVGTNGTKQQFRMAYDPDSSSFAGYWDYYAEQLMLYVLGAGAPNEEYRTGSDEYDGFTRKKGAFAGNDFIYSWFGSLFTYQYSQAFIDFRNLLDGDSVSWWDNSVDASLAAYDWCVAKESSFATYGEGSWGLTACDTKTGYNGYLGNYPRGWSASEGGSAYEEIEGTIAPCGALGSMPFTPENSLKALRNYASLDDLQGLYGFYDSYDLVNNWSATSYIGIDKGITLLMMDNYLHGTVWKLSNEIEAVQNGLERLGFKEKDS